MSAIGGVYNFDGAAVDDSVISALDQRLVFRGPDGAGRLAAGPVAMIHRAFHTNRESCRENQPCSSRYGHVLCWDGRLDNTTELLSSLAPEIAADSADAHVVMAAYVKWGIDFLPRLVGDFALSLWDPLSNSLVLAVDIIGPRSLYFLANQQRIIWSSDLG